MLILCCMLCFYVLYWDPFLRLISFSALLLPSQPIHSSVQSQGLCFHYSRCTCSRGSVSTGLARYWAASLLSWYRYRSSFIGMDIRSGRDPNSPLACQNRLRQWKVTAISRLVFTYNCISWKYSKPHWILVAGSYWYYVYALLEHSSLRNYSCVVYWQCPGCIVSVIASLFHPVPSSLSPTISL